jgi:hypothetical protein
MEKLALNIIQKPLIPLSISYILTDCHAHDLLPMPYFFRVNLTYIHTTHAFSVGETFQIFLRDTHIYNKLIYLIVKDKKNNNLFSDELVSTDMRAFDPKPQPPPIVSKSTTLRNWLEDSWLRPPAGILVPLRPMALNRALAVWNDLTVGGLNVSDIVIVGYDTNGKLDYRTLYLCLCLCLDL